MFFLTAFPLVSALTTPVALECVRDPIPKIQNDGGLVTVNIFNDLGYDVEVCVHDYNGVMRRLRRTPFLNAQQTITLMTGENFPISFRKAIPHLMCVGPVAAGPITFKTAESKASLNLGVLSAICTVSPDQSLLRRLTKELATGEYVGLRGERVSWAEIQRVKQLPDSYWKPFGNLNGGKKLLQNIPDGTKLWEARLRDSAGSTDTMRLIMSEGKTGKFTARAVISHVPGVTNNFGIARLIPTAEQLAVIGTGAAAQQAVAAEVAAAVQVVEDVAIVGETIAEAATWASLWAVAVEVAEVLIAGLLFL